MRFNQSAPKDESAVSAARAIDYNFSQARKRIQAATGNKQLNSLPTVFLLGDAPSANTGILTQSGLDPQLLTGQAPENAALTPTASINLWFSHNSLFVDPSQDLVANPGARRKLFNKFLPMRFDSLLASRIAPARSVLLTVDCGTFLQSGGVNAITAKAREYHAILYELSRALGASFPVYVLFINAGKLPYFQDFVENLSETEISELLGLSLPLSPAGIEGNFDEKQSLRLNNAFQTIYYSLADKRPACLAREHNAPSLSNIYEFPREFAKLRPLVVQFLLDLCRPSQPGTGPFLRGFYFAGVRTSAHQAATQDPPQWVFLRNLFPGVLLADKVAATAQVNVRVNFARRALLAAVAAIALLLAIWWNISYRNNSRLVEEALAGARSLSQATVNPHELASLDSLSRLSKVRSTLNQMKRWKTSAQIVDPLRASYFTHFRRLLLLPAQQHLVEILTNPGDPAQRDSARYHSVYNALKAYLITTDFHEKAAAWASLPEVLMQSWKQDEALATDRQSEALSNFAFYAHELASQNPYPHKSNDAARENARVFLNAFPLKENLYRSMLEAAGNNRKPIVFNADYPGTAETVVNTFEVDPCFTKTGYSDFHRQLQNPARMIEDEWVLGRRTPQDIDMNQIMAELRDRYIQEFTSTWRDFLAATSEQTSYASYQHAADVLAKLGGEKSPLLQLFCVASDNTSVLSKDLSRAFQTVQRITPPDCQLNGLISHTAKPYVESLLRLSHALGQIGSRENPNEVMALQAQSLVGDALRSEAELQVGFKSQPAGDLMPSVQEKSDSLLKDPIEKVAAMLDGVAASRRPGKAIQ